MNLKIISVLGVMALMVGVWFFYKEDVKIEPTVPSAPTVSYEVTEIKAVQTNPKTGEIEYTLMADSLIKNSAGMDEMRNAKMDWTPPNGAKPLFRSQSCRFGADHGRFVIARGFCVGTTRR